MWKPFKKKKGAEIPPGRGIEFEFATSWRRDKNEVAIITDKGPVILDENSEFFMEISGDSIDSLKIQIVPDFKKRVLNFIEVIDPNAKPGKNKGKISLVSDTMLNDANVQIGKYLNEWDKNIETYSEIIKKYNRRKNILLMIGIIVIFIDMYLFYINGGIARYISGIVILILIYTSINLEKSYRRMLKSHETYKEMRSKVFEVVKEK